MAVALAGSASNIADPATSVAATTPANQAGDIILVVAGGNSGGGGVFTIADGDSNSYTLLTGDDVGGAAGRVLYVWWRRSTGTTTPVVTASFNQNNRITIGVTVWRGCRTSGSPVNAQGLPSDGASAATKTAAGVTTTVDACMLVFLGASGGGATYTANGFTAPTTTVAYNDTGRYVTYGAQAAAGASGNKSNTWTDAGSHSGRVMLLALEPAGTTYSETLTEAGTAADSVTTTQAMVAVLAEAAAAAEVLAATQAMAESLAEAAAAADSLADQLFHGAVYTEYITEGAVADAAVAAAQVMVAALVEAAESAAVLQHQLEMGEAISEVAAAADLVSSYLGAPLGEMLGPLAVWQTPTHFDVACDRRAIEVVCDRRGVTAYIGSREESPS